MRELWQENNMLIQNQQIINAPVKGTNHKEPGKPTKKGEALERETTNLRKIQNPNSKNNESDYSLAC